MNTSYPENFAFKEFCTNSNYIFVFLYKVNNNEFYYLRWVGYKYSLDNSINNWIVRVGNEYRYEWISLNNQLKDKSYSSPLEQNYKNEYDKALFLAKKYSSLL